MNKFYLYCLSTSLAFIIASCNSSNNINDNTVDSAAIASDTATHVPEVMPIAEENKLAPNEISLTQADFPVVVTVPENTDIKKVKIEPQTWGGIEITVGENFQIQIASGQGNIALRKSDLANDDLYKVEYLVDNNNAIVYRKYIPDTDLQEYHFYIIAKTSSGYYEVEDIPGNQFSKNAIMKMFDSAKKLKSIKS